MLASSSRGDVRPQRPKGAPSTRRGDVRLQRPKGASPEKHQPDQQPLWSTISGNAQRPMGAPPEKHPPDQQPLSSTSAGDTQRPKGAPPDPPPPGWRPSARTRSGRGGKGSRRRREARLATQKILRDREVGAAVGSAAVTYPKSERAGIPAGGVVTCTLHDFAGKGWLAVTAQSTAGMLALLGALACSSAAPTSPTGHALTRVPKTFTCQQCQLVVATPERVAARMVADGWPLPKTCGACKKERTRRWAVRRLQTWLRRHLLQRRLSAAAGTAAKASGGDHRGSHGDGVGRGTAGGPPGGDGRGDDGGSWSREEPDSYPSSSGDDGGGGGGDSAGRGAVGDALPRLCSSGAPPVAADPAEGLAVAEGAVTTVAQGAGLAAEPASSPAPPAAADPTEAAEPMAWGAGGPEGTPHTPAPAAAAMTETTAPMAWGVGGPGGTSHTFAPEAAAMTEAAEPMADLDATQVGSGYVDGQMLGAGSPRATRNARKRLRRRERALETKARRAAEVSASKTARGSVPPGGLRSCLKGARAEEDQRVAAKEGLLSDLVPISDLTVTCSEAVALARRRLKAAAEEGRARRPW